MRSLRCKHPYFHGGRQAKDIVELLQKLGLLQGWMLNMKFSGTLCLQKDTWEDYNNKL